MRQGWRSTSDPASRRQEFSQAVKPRRMVLGSEKTKRQHKTLRQSLNPSRSLPHREDSDQISNKSLSGTPSAQHCEIEPTHDPTYLVFRHGRLKTVIRAQKPGIWSRFGRPMGCGDTATLGAVAQTNPILNLLSKPGKHA